MLSLQSSQVSAGKKAGDHLREKDDQKNDGAVATQSMAILSGLRFLH